MRIELILNFESKQALSDFAILEKYGFDFERNIKEMIKQTAEQLRKSENASKKLRKK